jgi:tetratricopeptide (TPR) repeat protein
MDNNLEKKLNRLADQDKFGEIVALIEQIPEDERDWPLVGWYIRSLNNSDEYERAEAVSLQYRAQGEKDPHWHYRYGYALLALGRDQEAEAALYRAKEIAREGEPVIEWIDELLEMVEEYRQNLENKARRLEEKAEIEARRRAAKIPRDPNVPPFEGFDFSGFWDESDYALEEYTGAPPTIEQFAAVEKTLGYKLPESYKWLMRQRNGGIPLNTCHPTETPTSWAFDHAAISGIMGVDPAKKFSLVGDLGSRFMIEEWGYPDIGIAICECPSAGHDMIFLDYRLCGPQGEPEVVHIDQEQDYEITLLADDFESFILGLRSDDAFEQIDPELYTEKEMEAVESHIDAWFGKYANVFHEIISPDIHVDICVVDPTPERNYYTLVTMGMGAHRMNVPEELYDSKLSRAELLIALPPDWDIKSDDERWYWPIRWLKILARLPLNHDTWLGYGHTVPNGEPFAQNTELCGVLLTIPYFFDAEAFVCKLPDGDVVNFYQVLPIYENEMDFKIENGAEALESLFPVDFDMVVDVARKNVMDAAKKNVPE